MQRQNKAVAGASACGYDALSCTLFRVGEAGLALESEHDIQLHCLPTVRGSDCVREGGCSLRLARCGNHVYRFAGKRRCNRGAAVTKAQRPCNVGQSRAFCTRAMGGPGGGAEFAPVERRRHSAGHRREDESVRPQGMCGPPRDRCHGLHVALTRALVEKDGAPRGQLGDNWATTRGQLGDN